MVKQLVLISPPGERLTLRLGEGIVESGSSTPADEVTHVIIEPSTVQAEPRAAAPDGLPPRKPDIIMTFVAGAPTPEADPTIVRTAPNKVTLSELATFLTEAPEGSRSVILLGGDRGD